MEQVALKYTGNGDFLPGVPARDLTADEAKEHGGEKALIATGLYEKAPDKAKSKKEGD